MKPTILLKISSVIMILHDFGHLFGFLGWSKGTTSEEEYVIHAMTDHRFPVIGVMRSFADLYNGFGNIATVSILLMAVLLWMTGSFAAQFPTVSKKLAGVLFIGLFLQSMLEFIYFFPAAALMTLLAALLTGVSFLRIKTGGA
jgi:hypothetical protein